MIINVIAMFYGNETKILNKDISRTISYGNIILTYTQLAQFCVSVGVIGLFLFLLKFSRFGIRTRAMRDDPVLCTVFGMNINNMRLLLFALSAVFVSIGSGLVAHDVGMDPYVGLPMLINAVVALIIGGVGRFEAPIVGGFIIGVLQSLTVWAFSARWENAVTFALLLFFLILRPQGILGEKQRMV